jgi:hypothetical protein
MRIDKLTPVALAQFGANLVTLLGGTELSSIDASLRTALIAEIGTKPAELMAQDAAIETLKAQLSAAYATREATFDGLAGNCKQVRDTLKAVIAPRDQYELAGFDAPDMIKTTYVAQTPSGLSVVGFSNGVNKGKFKGNNKSASVVYEIWRRQRDSGDWGIITITKHGKFTDNAVTPGLFYEYKVRAQAAKNTSEWSNTAVVYG